MYYFLIFYFFVRTVRTQYDSSGKGHLTKRNLEVMLYDVGIRMERVDINRFVYFFNVNKQTGNYDFISLFPAFFIVYFLVYFEFIIHY